NSPSPPRPRPVNRPRSTAGSGPRNNERKSGDTRNSSHNKWIPSSVTRLRLSPQFKRCARPVGRRHLECPLKWQRLRDIAEPVVASLVAKGAGNHQPPLQIFAGLNVLVRSDLEISHDPDMALIDRSGFIDHWQIQHLSFRIVRRLGDPSRGPAHLPLNRNVAHHAWSVNM